MVKKIKRINSFVIDLVVDSLLIFMYAVGKGMTKYSNQHRGRVRPQKPTRASSKKIVKSLQLRSRKGRRRF